MTNKTREDFETWAKANDLNPIRRRKDGQYVYWESEWIAYQAATQQSAARIAALEAEVLALRKSLHSNKEWRKQMQTFIEAERGEG